MTTMYLVIQMRLNEERKQLKMQVYRLLSHAQHLSAVTLFVTSQTEHRHPSLTGFNDVAPQLKGVTFGAGGGMAVVVLDQSNRGRLETGTALAASLLCKKPIDNDTTAGGINEKIGSAVDGSDIAASRGEIGFVVGTEAFSGDGVGVSVGVEMRETVEVDGGEDDSA